MCNFANYEEVDLLKFAGATSFHDKKVQKVIFLLYLHLLEKFHGFIDPVSSNFNSKYLFFCSTSSFPLPVYWQKELKIVEPLVRQNYHYLFAQNLIHFFKIQS